jgi:hypothetical protein
VRLAYHAVMTTPLASGEPQILRADTIGGAWFAVAGRIVADGRPSRYDEQPIREISLVTLAIARPDPDDEIIARHAEPERLAWMHANFTDRSRVRPSAMRTAMPPGCSTTSTPAGTRSHG